MLMKCVLFKYALSHMRYTAHYARLKFIADSLWMHRLVYCLYKYSTPQNTKRLHLKYQAMQLLVPEFYVFNIPLLKLRSPLQKPLKVETIWANWTSACRGHIVLICPPQGHSTQRYCVFHQSFSAAVGGGGGVMSLYSVWERSLLWNIVYWFFNSLAPPWS